MNFFKEFFQQYKFVRSLSGTFLVLVLKKQEDALDFKDYKPIRWGGGLYNNLVKVLPYILKRVLGKGVQLKLILCLLDFLNLVGRRGFGGCR